MGSGTVAPVSDAAYPFPNKVRLPVAFRRGYPAKDTTNKRMWQPGGLPHPCLGSRKIKDPPDLANGSMGVPAVPRLCADGKGHY